MDETFHYDLEGRYKRFQTKYKYISIKLYIDKSSKKEIFFLLVMFTCKRKGESTIYGYLHNIKTKCNIYKYIHNFK